MNTTTSRFTWVGLVASALVVTSLVGCDTTPTESTESSQPTSEQGLFKKGKGMRISKKEGPTQAPPKQPNKK